MMTLSILLKTTLILGAGHATVVTASTIAALLLVAISPLQVAVRGQAQPFQAGAGKPRFEVAAIKPCNGPEDLQPGRASTS